jgi:ankyrin repeat protein
MERQAGLCAHAPRPAGTDKDIKSDVRLSTFTHRASSCLSLLRAHVLACCCSRVRVAPVDACSQDGTTPLIAAAAGGHEEILRLLLAKGAEVNLQKQVRGQNSAS